MTTGDNRFFMPRPCMAIGCGRIAFNGGRWCVGHLKDEDSQQESYEKNRAAWTREHPNFAIPRANWIYAVAGADLVKFGVATNLQTRLTTLQGGSPVELHIEAAIAEERAIEFAIHAHLCEYRRHGEWFSRAPETLRVIDLMKAGDKTALRTAINFQSPGLVAAFNVTNRRRRLGTKAAATVAIRKNAP